MGVRHNHSKEPALTPISWPLLSAPNTTRSSAWAAWVAGPRTVQKTRIVHTGEPQEGSFTSQHPGTALALQGQAVYLQRPACFQLGSIPAPPSIIVHSHCQLFLHALKVLTQTLHQPHYDTLYLAQAGRIWSRGKERKRQEGSGHCSQTCPSRGSESTGAFRAALSERAPDLP